MPPAAPYAKLPRRQALLFMLAALSIALVIGLGGVFKLGPAARLDRLALDTLLVHTASATPVRGTVVVDIDDVSLAALGQWPWPRYRLAALIERIAADHPSAIALDIMFPEADRASLANIQQTFKRDFGVDVSFAGVPAGLLDNDGYLGQQMAQSQVIGARYFYFDHVNRADHPLRPGVGFDGRIDLLSLERAPGALDNVQAIASQTRLNGFVNSRADDDGVLRRLPLLIEHDGVIHGSLALVASMRALGVDHGHIESGANGLSIRVGSHRIPVDQAGYALLRFSGPSQRYDSVPAVDVLAGRVDAAALRGKIVFVGSSAVGLNDVHVTAVDEDFSGAKLQAVMAQNILEGTSVRAPAWGSQAALALGLFVALALGSTFVTGHGLLRLSVVSVLIAAILVALLVMAFVRAGLFMPMGAPLLSLVTLLALAFVVRFALNQRRAQHWRQALENARQVTIESMAAVAETRDPETGAHIKRTQHYVRAVARQLQRTGHYTSVLSKDYIHLLFLSAPLHDIGKVGVPDHILLKPGRLTDDEMQIMKRHAEFGRQIIFSTAARIEGDNFLEIAGEIAATHHEKWDGTGYPLGLRGQEIPLSGRIMTVADIYDALISRRCYKEPFPHARAKAMMSELRGATFDPVVLDAFFAIEAEILQIAARYRDESEGHEVLMHGAETA